MLDDCGEQYTSFVRFSTGNKTTAPQPQAKAEISLDPSIKLRSKASPEEAPSKVDSSCCEAHTEQRVPKEPVRVKTGRKNVKERVDVRKTKKKKHTRRKPQKGCRCSKSKCLRLHCVCFRNGTFCGKDCGCKGCYNSEKNKDLVNEVRKATKDINSQAFESRFVEIKFGDKTMRFTKGCSCSKNNCQKNYCECFKNGLPCTPLCKCENCHNEKCNIEPKMASKLFKKSSRKKKKIVFKTNSDNAIEMTEEILISKHKA